MCDVCVQSMHQRRSLENNANSRVAMTVNPSLVTLGQPKPTLQIKIVRDLLKLPSSDEESGKEANHHGGHVLANRILSPLELINQLFELLLALRAIRFSKFKGCGFFFDVFHVVSDCLLFGPNVVQASVDAVGESAELLFREPHFFLVKFRWIDSNLIQRIRHPQAREGEAVLPDRR